MDAKLSHFSELSDFLSEKSTVCNDFSVIIGQIQARTVTSQTQNGEGAANTRL